MPALHTDPNLSLKQDINRVWDYWSGRWDGEGVYGMGSAEEKQAWLKTLHALVGPGLHAGGPALTVADVGSGTGGISLLLAELGHRVRGFDLSDGMVTASRRKAAGLTCRRWSVLDARSVTYPAPPFEFG